MSASFVYCANTSTLIVCIVKDSVNPTSPLSTYNTLICNEYVQAATFSSALSPDIREYPYSYHVVVHLYNSCTVNTTSFADDNDINDRDFSSTTLTSYPISDSMISSECLRYYKDENEDPEEEVTSL